jgi:hypothetical protein
MVAVPAEGAGMAADERIRFCTNCGRLYDPESPETKRPHRDRVCESCCLGVLLSTTPDMLSRDGQALLVVTGDVLVSAASEAALELFAADWSDVVSRPLLSLLDSPIRGSELARRVSRAAGGSGDTALVRVEVDGRTHQVRVGRCGDPRAALVVFEDRG